ncbi:MAG TPA: cell division protein FtsL [Nitrosospira sp.]
MIRINILLTLILVACALSVVTSQHEARKLFVEFEKEQELARQLAVEWDQLRLEQSTWATHARIEKIATEQLLMQLPDASRLQVLAPANSHGSDDLNSPRGDRNHETE